MDKPLAFKEQVGWAASFAETGAALTGLIGATLYRCPDCRHVYKVVLGPGDAFLGEGERACSKCKRVFRDRSMEWPVLRGLDRFFFLFPGLICGWMLFALIVSALIYWAGWTHDGIPLLLPVVVFFVAPLLPWLLFRSYQIVCSVHRINLHEKEKGA